MKKSGLSILVTLVLLGLMAAPVHAQEAVLPLTGTVQSIIPEIFSDPGETTVLVAFVDDLGENHTVRIGLETAVALGLVTVDQATGEVTANSSALGSNVTFDPATVIGGPAEEQEQHPVGSSLSEFFSSLLGVDYETIMANHDEGVGFGVIAQALWMTNALEGDTATFQAILDAKKDGDFSMITLPDGGSPTNWGQFRKAVMGDKEKAKNNLGAVMSGHAADESKGEDQAKADRGNGGSSDKQGANGDAPGNGNKNKDKNKDKGNK
jgi:hypothetical protein